MSTFLQICSSKFPVLQGEAEEVTNPGTFGKSFAQYLQERLVERNYAVPSICCEGWGWWVGVQLSNALIGLCCYRAHDESKECDFACTTSVEKARVWSWKRFRYLDLSDELAPLDEDLKAILSEDPDVEFVGEKDDNPL